MRELLWLIPVLPFVGVLLNGVLLRGRISKKATAAIACGVIGCAAVLTLLVITDSWGTTFERDYYTWMPVGAVHSAADGVRNLRISMGFLLDPLSSVMLLVVTFVGFWIHVYSVGYMAEEPGFQRYFTYLNLFMGAMLLLVLGNNYAVMFVGWEGVGLCSYLLIGFYFDQEFPPYAGRKAFITNRVGDFGFILGLCTLVATFGSLHYSEIFGRIAENPALVTGPYHLGLTVAGFVALCLFIGAMGKSAQIPLYVWLPDAMAGPTPVSALIHAATMVTAGVYMVVRSNVIYQLAPGISGFVAVLGAATAIFAATIAIAQTDIKKVLAYSTVSQLGYMFLAAGLGAYTAAVFHLMTHAFFKALLFLGSGAVIHAMGGEQDMRKMGGLKQYLPQTSRTFWIGCLAIAGIPPFAGFFSKDEILHSAAAGRYWLLWAVGLITAGLTACYMFRAYFMTFAGSFRGTPAQEHHLHEAPATMVVPLWVLAVGAVLAGLAGIPRALTFGWLPENRFRAFLEPVVASIAKAGHAEAEVSTAAEWALMGIAVVVAVAGILTARYLYRNAGLEKGRVWAERLPAVHRVLLNKYYVDELYEATVIRGAWALAAGLHRFDAAFIDGFLVNGTRNVTVHVLSLGSGLFDRYVVDGLVNLTGRSLSGVSRGLRRVQTGAVASYALIVAIGMFALVCAYMVLRRG